jgi:hypothetical protein
MKRGRGLMDNIKKGLAISKSLGVGSKLSSASDPRVAMAGKLLSMAGGAKHRPTYHYVKLSKHRYKSTHVPKGFFYSKIKGVTKCRS